MLRPRDFQVQAHGHPLYGGRHRASRPTPASTVLAPRDPVMPGPLYTRSGAVMAAYDRLWRLALIKAERALRGAFLP